MQTVAIQGTILTSFVTSASVEAARAIVHKAERVALAGRDGLHVLDVLENPPRPSSRLLRAAETLPDLG